MEKLTVTLKTVTPMFLGGANPNDTAELRAPSIKGALRFWYRAIDPEYNRKVNPSDSKSPTWEEKIFGSTEHGQGSFLIKVILQDVKNGEKGNKFQKSTAYLGYGPITRGKANKAYIKPNYSFTVEIVFKKADSSDAIFNKIEQSLWALCMFGGLGSRSRRGFGSLMVTDVIGGRLKLPWEFNNFKSFKEGLKEFCKSIPKEQNLPIHTCFSEKTRCVTVLSKKGMNALEWLGREFLNYRSFYSDKPPNFEDDKNMIFNYLYEGTVPSTSPLRTAFGLPHNYFFTQSFKSLKGRAPKNLFENDTIEKLLTNNIVTQTSDGKYIYFVNKDAKKNTEFKGQLKNLIDNSKEVQNILHIWQKSLKGNVEINLIEDDQKGRRASPIIFHIQKFKDDTECVVATFFPSKFIPDNKRVTISDNFDRSSEISLSGINFKAIDDFMNRLVNNGGETIL